MWLVHCRSAMGWLLVLECWFVCVVSVNGRLGFFLCKGREAVRVCVCSL